MTNTPTPELTAPAIEALETLVATSGHPYKDGLAAVIKSALSSGYCIIEPAPPMLETLQGREAAALIKKYADCGVANPTLSALMEAVGKNRVYEARDLFAENAKNSPLTNEPVGVEVDANDHTMGGSLVFKGSRILVSSIVKWVRQGASNDDIMAAYPDLTNDQIEGVRGFLDAANEPVGVTDDMTPPPDPITTARPPIRIYALDAAVYDDGSFDIQEHNQHSIGFKRSREAVIILRDELTRLIEAGPYLCPEAKVRS